MRRQRALRGTVAAMSGAIDTATSVPRGIFTGRADATAVRTDQKIESGQRSLDPQMRSKTVTERPIHGK